MDIPHVHILIQYHHAQLVTGVQDGLADGIVGGADRIVPGLFQQLDLPPLGERMARRAQHTVVMVDARAQQDHALAIDAEATLCVHLYGPDTETHLLHILPAGQATHAKMRSCRAPQRRVRDLQLHRSRGLPAQQHFAAGEDFRAHHGGFAGAEVHPDPPGLPVQGADGDALRDDVLFRQADQRHGPVDARAGVPAGGGLLRVAGDDPDGVLPGSHRHLEAEVAVGVRRHGLAVQRHLRPVVHPLEFQVRRVLRGGEGLLVHIVPGRKEAGVGAAGAVLHPGLGEHGVVGEGDGLPVLLPQVGIPPAGVHADDSHGVLQSTEGPPQGVPRRPVIHWAFSAFFFMKQAAMLSTQATKAMAM